MQQKIKLQGKSPKTFETYWQWTEDYLKFLRNRNHGEWIHPKDCGREQIEDWLTWLANYRHVAKSSQNTALQSVLYLYREILGISIENVSAMRSQQAKRVREVISVEEVGRLFEQLDGVALLASQLMYGCGLRISDVVGLRLKDISFDRKQLCIKQGKGDKSRFTAFPEVIHDAVRRQIQSVKVVWRHDSNDNPNGVSLPDSFRKKSPNAATELRWYWLFPGDNLSKGEEGILCRHHRHPDHIARQIKEAADRAGILSRVTSHVLRHSYATHAHEQGVPMRTLMQLLGHTDIRTTEIYVHADEHGATSSKSPLETILQNPSIATESRKQENQTPKLRLFVG
jgi:integron integrase